MPEHQTSRSGISHVLIVVGIAAGALLVYYFIKNPDVINNIWLWLAGLAGPVIAIVRNGFSSLSDLFEKVKPNNDNTTVTDRTEIETLKTKLALLETKVRQTDIVEDTFNGTTITVLRYIDDGETSLGLLFIENAFFSYTLEDAHHEVKVPGKTRIPAGTYSLDFRREVTPLTQRYRTSRPWFDYHLEIKNVENFTGIYIHTGSNHTHTDGCLLIAGSIHATNAEKTIFNSKQTFEIFYKKIKSILDSGREVRIVIRDESWFDQFIRSKKYVKSKSYNNV